MSDGASIYQMVSGIGDGFARSYKAAREQAQEDETPAILANLTKIYGGGAGSPGLVPPVASAGSLAAPAATTATDAPVSSPLPSFARAQGAMPSEKLRGLITDVATRNNIDPNYLPKLVQIESNGDPNAYNKGSGASGLGQFIPKTAQAYGLTDPFDPVANLNATARLTLDNRETLRGRLGRDPTNGELYLGHQQGAAGAARLLSNPDLPAARLVGMKAVLANGGTADMTAREFASKWTSRFDGAPDAPVAVASAEPDAANMPAKDAVPAAGFFIPPGGGDQGAPASAAAGGLGGLSGDQQAALSAAWRNPNTRPLATAIYQQLLTGKGSGWEMKDVNGQSAWVNPRTQQVIPIGQAKRQTATVGNVIVDTATGQPIYTAPEKESDKLTSVAPGTTLYDPRQRQPVFTAPAKDDKDEGAKIAAQIAARKQEAAGLGLVEGSPAWQSFVGTGKIGRDQDLSATDKKAILEADEKIMGIQGTLTALGKAKELSKQAYSGPLASTRGYLGSIIGLEGAEKTQELDNTITASALDSLKATFGAAPTEGERKILLDIQGSSSQSPAVREAIYARAEQALQRRLAFEQARADDLRGGTFYKKGQGASAAPAPAGGGVPKGDARVQIPDGKSAGAAVAEARQFVKANPGMKAQAAERLRSWGIDPKRLDD